MAGVSAPASFRQQLAGKKRRKKRGRKKKAKKRS